MSHHKSPHLYLLTAASTMALLASGLSGPAAPASAASDDPIVISGLLRGADGPSAGSVWYSIAEVGPPSGGKPGTSFDDTTGLVRTYDDGRYELRLDPEDLPESYWMTGQRIIVNLVAEVGKQQMQWGTSVDLRRSTSAPRWVAGQQTDDGSYQPLHLDFDFGAAQGTATQRSATGAPLRRATGAAVEVPESMTLASRDPGACATTYGKKYRLQEKFMRVMNWTGAKAKVTQGKASTHALGVGTQTTLPKGSLGWKATGEIELTKNIRESLKNLVGVSLYNKVNYQDRIYACSDGRGHTVQYTYREPRGVHTAFSKKAPLTRYNFLTTHCTRRGANYDVTMSSSRNETMTAGVDLGPISVSAQSGYNKGTSLHVDPTRKTWVCWNDPDGLEASSQAQFRKNRYRTEPCGRPSDTSHRCRTAQ